MKQSWRRFVGVLGILAIGFAQVVYAAYACPLPPAAAGIAQSGTSEACEQDFVNPALCIKYCQDEPQKAPDASWDSISFDFVPLYSIALTFEAPSRYLPIASPTLLHARPLPVSIRNCCFRI